MNLKRLVASTAAISAAAAAVNMLGTVALVRWFGPQTYANYVIDLAYLSVALVILEIAPSSYFVFAVQDRPEKLRAYAAITSASGLLICAAVLLCGSQFDIFQAFTPWIAMAAGAMAVKRYLDVRMQSTGRLAEYFWVELGAATCRIAILGVCLRFGTGSAAAAWMSLACAMLASQAIWFSLRRNELPAMAAILDARAWRSLLDDRNSYVRYYPGIALKRLRDNLLPIAAGHFFASKEALSGFFLAYRGVIFTASQVRIIEGLLNHRATLDFIRIVPLAQQILVAVSAQVASIVASIALLFAAGVDNYEPLQIVVLSAIVWFSVFSIIKRAEAYSQFRVNAINAAMIAYCLVLTGSIFVLHSLGSQSILLFSLVLVIAEGVSVGVMWACSRQRG